MNKITTLICSLLLIVGLGCEGLDNDEKDDEKTGTLSVLLSDNPFPLGLVDSALVTIDSVEIRRHGETIGSPFIILNRDQVTFNLLDLRNGVTASLSEMDVPVGAYDLVRLYVNSARLVLTNGSDFEVIIPSGEQTGLKIFINPYIEIVGGLTSELLLDFDVSKSFVMQGNMNSPSGIVGFHFKPTLRASNLSTAGRLEGIVTDSDGIAALGGAQVWIEAMDTIMTTTFSSTDSLTLGHYALLGVPAGDFTAKAAMAGYDTVSAFITITAGNVTTQDFSLISQ